MRKNNKRSTILEAAFKVAEDQGAGHLTIDAVAAKSGVSKGGVLYHFESKHALLTGMLEHMVALNQEQIMESTTASPDNNMLAAILHTRETMTPAEHRATQALIAAAAEDSNLLAPARDHYGAIFSKAASQSKDEMAATVLLLASEALRLLDVLDINPLDQKKMANVVEYMHQEAVKL